MPPARRYSIKLAVDEVGKLGCGVVLVWNVPAPEQELQFWLQLVWFRLHAKDACQLALGHNRQARIC